MRSSTSLAKITCLLALSVFAYVAHPPSLSAQGYETPPTFKASQIVDAKTRSGKHHKIKEEIRNDGYMNLFVIESDFGPFNARGRLRLRKLIREVYVLAKLKEISSSEVFLDAAKQAGTDIVMAPVRGAEKAYEMVTEPEKMVETAKKLPGGVARLFKSAGNAVQSGYEGVKKTHQKGSEKGYTAAYGGAAVGAVSDVASSYTGYGKAMRRWQQEMMIDPFTTNQALNSELRRIVTVESSVGMGKIFVPGIGLGIPYVGTVSRYHKRADQLALYDDPEKIKKNNVGAIEALGDVNEGNAKKFLNHPHITPTYRSLMLDNLSKMTGVKSRGDFIDVAINSNSEETTVFFLQASEQLLDYHKRVQPLDALVEGGMLPAGVTKKGKLIIPLAIDYIVWTKDVDRIFEGFKKRVEREHKVSGSEMRLTGSSSARFKQEMQKDGIRVVEKLPLL